MARTVKPKDAAPPEGGASDLEVLNPDVTLEVAGRKVTIREYGFFEGLDVAAQAEAFIRDMHVMCDGGDLRYASVRRLFGKHREVVVPIAARAGDVDPAWLDSLTSSDGEAYMATWFGVNSTFFVQEVIAEQQDAQLRARSQASGSMPSSPSPQPDSATSSSSGDSPSDN